MLEQLDSGVVNAEPFKTYVTSFRFTFYGVNRYYVMVNCMCKNDYKTKYITDVVNLPMALNNMIVKVREYMYNLSASGSFDGAGNGVDSNGLRETVLYLAIQDTHNQFKNAAEAWNLIMAYYHLVEARLQLMDCNYSSFQKYVTGPYIQYIGQA